MARKAERKRWCVCCGEEYFICGEGTHLADKMCLACNLDLEEMEGQDFYLFMADVEKVLKAQERVVRSEWEPTSIEELISVMDHTS